MILPITRIQEKIYLLRSRNALLDRDLAELEAKYDEQFGLVFEAIRQLLKDKDKPKRRIGF